MDDYRTSRAQLVVRNLSLAVTGSENGIELDDFQERPLKNHWLNGQVDQYHARAPIIRTVSQGRGVLAGIAGTDREEVVGHVEIRIGYVQSLVEEDIFYEKTSLTITQSLSRQDGQTIPRCQVQIYQEFEEFAEPHLERTDRIRRVGLFWPRADLSGVLPTGWFYENS